ncbi:TetR/AcrR family transcriptional regulator [Pelotomaculum terephthalicicum JT]|uniref:TetR/AcrR family transcriptional regulator n=1 Tax=Pelotomaculum TaxID=191373 RepID=UPI0009CBCC9A|nr:MULTISPECIES: TetR/AcrR family transcriptional regulator [Pelotomaculum]MCG9968675.1 TetR/AcrR family transcriptional regulator [Pelotomaculum terephthalicicum JT]OPX85682.1 MAG: putative HTH-type transcriptional regulator YfiR [Pelotomaculum sp. PtaB.Bin117]
MKKNKMQASKSEKDVSRENIQKAALRCFEEKGFKGATISDIAREAGISPASVYLCFSNKKELFESLQRPDLDFPSPKARVREQEIINAAREVFSEKGYAAATMEDVANMIGKSKAPLYSYFPSKEQLFDAVIEKSPVFFTLDTILNQLNNKTDAFYGNSKEEILNRLEDDLGKIAVSYLKMFDDEIALNFIRITLAEGTRNGKVSALFKKNAVEQGSLLLSEHLKNIGLRPVEELQNVSQAFMGMLASWAIVHRILFPENMDGQPDKISSQDDEMADAAKRAVCLFLYGLDGLNIHF